MSYAGLSKSGLDSFAVEFDADEREDLAAAGFPRLFLTIIAEVEWEPPDRSVGVSGGPVASVISAVTTLYGAPWISDDVELPVLLTQSEEWRAEDIAAEEWREFHAP